MSEGLQPQFFRHNHGHHGIASLADVIGAAEYDRVALSVEPYDGRGRTVMRRYQYRKSCAGHEAGSGKSDGFAASDRVFVAMFPVNGFRAFYQGFVELSGCKFQSCRSRVVRSDSVLPPQLQRVNVQIICHFVHVDFMSKMYLTGGISPHGP